MRLPLKFLLPATMVAVFVVTCVLYRWDQRVWERDHHAEVSEYREIPIPDPEVADLYEGVGYKGPGWLGVAYFLQLPGLVPVAVFSEPMPLHIYATWRIYCEDFLSICATWFAVGAWLDRRYKQRPPRFISLPLTPPGLRG
jgi:hypothetical protein